MSSKRLLVTGANGFLGSAVVAAAKRGGFPVVASDLGESGVDPEVEYRAADILESGAVASALDGVGVVVHAAGLAHVFDPSTSAPEAFDRINAHGTRVVAEAAVEAGVEHLVLISSVSVYGRAGSASPHGVAEDAERRPEGPYAESKRDAEDYAIEATRGSLTALTILRPATLYGEGDPGNVRRLIENIQGGRFLWIGSGANRKSLIHRDDVVRAILTVASQPPADEQVFNLSAPAKRMRDVVDAIASASSVRISSVRVPAQLALIASSAGGLISGRFRTLNLTIRKWLEDDVYDGRRFEKTFGVEAKVSLLEGIEREVAWLREAAGGDE